MKKYKTKQDQGHLSDNELLFLFKHRKVDSFKILLERYAPLITKLTNKYFVSGYDRDDLTQEAYIVFQRSLENFDVEKGFTIGQYYKTALTNEFRSLLRKDITEKRVINKRTDSLEKVMEDGGPTYSGILENEQISPEHYAILNESIRKCFSNLSPFEKEVFMLYPHKKIEEIAELLSSSESKVANAVDRCKRKLKAELNR